MAEEPDTVMQGSTGSDTEVQNGTAGGGLSASRASLRRGRGRGRGRRGDCRLQPRHHGVPDVMSIRDDIMEATDAKVEVIHAENVLSVCQTKLRRRRVACRVLTLRAYLRVYRWLLARGFHRGSGNGGAKMVEGEMMTASQAFERYFSRDGVDDAPVDEEGAAGSLAFFGGGLEGDGGLIARGEEEHWWSFNYYQTMAKPVLAILDTHPEEIERCSYRQFHMMGAYLTRTYPPTAPPAASSSASASSTATAPARRPAEMRRQVVRYDGGDGGVRFRGNKKPRKRAPPSAAGATEGLEVVEAEWQGVKLETLKVLELVNGKRRKATACPPVSRVSEEIESEFNMLMQESVFGRIKSTNCSYPVSKEDILMVLKRMRASDTKVTELPITRCIHAHITTGRTSGILMLI